MSKYYEDVVNNLSDLPTLAEEAKEYGLDDFLYKFVKDPNYPDSKKLAVMADLVLYYGAPHLLD
jgi:hypothetical protein